MQKNHSAGVQVNNGALSACPAGEGHTWGKVSAECVETSSVYAHCDVTAALPWITCALLGADLHRRPKRLFGRLDAARGALLTEVRAHRADLLRGIEDE